MHTENATSELDRIGLKHGTDQASDRHGYLETLERYFAPLRDQPLNILEIGVAGGASVRTWRDYFPNAAIFGMDHNIKFVEDLSRALDAEGDTRITVRWGEATDPAAWHIFDDVQFDIVIDDGGHYSEMIIKALSYGWGYLKRGGLWIVEDVHFVYQYAHGKGEQTFVDYLKQVIDGLNERGARECGKPHPDAPMKGIYIYKSLVIFERSAQRLESL